MQKKILLVLFVMLMLFPIYVNADELTIMPIDPVVGDATLLRSKNEEKQIYEYLLIDVGIGDKK